MNYYPHHIGDYAKDTGHLSWDEDMAYTRLLRAYYSREGPIPADQAYRLARASSTAQRKAVDTVLGEFFTEQADGWHNKRADAELAIAQDKSEKARTSAAKRWQSNGSNANAMRTHTEGNAPNNQEPRTKENIGRGSRLSHTNLPTDWAQFCLTERPDLDPEKTFASFADHWKAVPGAKGVKLDWEMTWRNWVRAQWTGRGPKPSPEIRLDG